jgi:hypothetical protein
MDKSYTFHYSTPMDTLPISPEYLTRLIRVQEALRKTGRTISLPGLVEAIVSEWLYEMETDLELSPRGLPVEEIDGKRYYRDERLGEYRHVDNPHERLPF